MGQIIDKIILIVLSIVIMQKEQPVYKFWQFNDVSNQASIVITFLITLICATLCSYVSEERKRFFVCGFYLICMIFLPSMFYTVPVIFYDIWCDRNVLGIGLFVVCALICANSFSWSILLLVVIICTIGAIIGDKTKRNEQLEILVKKIRDSEEEKNILLANKNRNLLEKQDYEIYVATLRERNRIAREIHDNVGHMLTRSILQVGALMTIHKEQPLNDHLDAVKSSLDVAMNNIRESVHDLHDESIDLKQSLREMIQTLDGKFKYNFDYDISSHVDRKYKYAILGIVKEGISNIIKHSNNDMVDIILREHPGMFQLIIHDYKDDPRLTDKSNAEIKKSDGIGLENIRDRVSGLNGNVEIDKSNGFKIFITLPKQN